MTIYSFAFENFFSFEAKTEVSFITDKRTNLNEKGFEPESSDERLNKVLAVIGANGAGKTNLIKPLAYMLWFITDSFFCAEADDNRHFIRPYMFNEKGIVDFTLDFGVGKDRYRYRLAKTPTKVYGEILEKKTSRLWSKLFVRTWDKESGEYNIIRRSFGNRQLPLKDVGDNVSLISLAAQYKSKVATVICDELRKRTTNTTMFGRNIFFGAADVSDATEFYLKNKAIKEEMVRFLREQDFGITEMELEEYERVQEDGSKSKAVIPWTVHKRGDQSVKLPLMLESSGTQSAYHLLSLILPLLKTGGIMIYDELEGDLHPHMIEPILQLFFSPRTNPHNAQIIFTTHSIEVLNYLQKNQAILVEKNDSASEAWKLSDMDGVRSDDNFYAKYMSGAYGAVPRM